jgi:hypothetical protein
MQMDYGFNDITNLWEDKQMLSHGVWTHLPQGFAISEEGDVHSRAGSHSL